MKRFKITEPSEKLLRIKKEILQHVDILEFDWENFKLDEELIEFATGISKNIKNLTEQTYYSENKTYAIEMYETFNDFQAGGLKTPARIGTNGGVIQFQKSKLISDYTEDFVYYVTIWCVIEFCVLNLKQSDIIATKHYLTTSKSKENLYKGYETMLEANELKMNNERLKNVCKLLDEKALN